MELKLEDLKSVGIKDNLRDDVLRNVGGQMARFKVDGFLRISHFMAQVCHESGGFTIGTENMNYTNPFRLMQVWPTRFKTLDLAKQYVGNPQKLANFVYANRMGNGKPETNDGYNFRGRGPMQTTGKESYTKFGKKIFGDDRLLTNPDLLADLQYGIQAAFIEWDEGNCNALADKDDIVSITRKINGGTVGLDSRKKWLAEWKHALHLSNPAVSVS